VVPLLPPEEAGATARDAIAAAERWQDEGSRAWNLEEIGSHLPEELLPDVLAAAMKLGEAEPRVRVVSKIFPRLSPADQHRCLLNFLDSAAALDRQSLLGSLSSFLPAISEVGGHSALTDVARVIADTGAWFP
jgi:hypothetical protein